MTFTAKDTILTCGECNKEVYRATQGEYDPLKLRKAVHDHKMVCPNRREAST